MSGGPQLDHTPKSLTEDTVPYQPSFKILGLILMISTGLLKGYWQSEEWSLKGGDLVGTIKFLGLNFL